MKYIGIDPGGTSGIAYTIRNAPPSTWQLEQMPAIELVEDLVLGEYAVIFCESFVPRPGVRTWQPAALEIIGALRWICHQNGVDFHLQSPASAKKFSSDAKLKKLGWYRPGKGHANDALRHLLLGMVKLKAIDPSEFA